MRGDTIVNGLTCKKYGYVNGDGTFGCTSIFRQDGDKIYSLNFNTGEFYLTYDFGAKMGDVITIGLARIEVTGTDVITARDHELRRISFKVIEEYDDNGWTEIQGNYGGSWINGTFDVCTTKPNYVPHTTTCDNTYIQNLLLAGTKTYETGYAMIGSDVTDKVAQGAVVVNSGSTIVKASQGVTITKDFEVIPGAEFTITNQ